MRAGMAELTEYERAQAYFEMNDYARAVQLLEPFADNKINLTRIESRPLKGKPWEYVFFLDFLGHRKERRVARALTRLEGLCEMLKVLGRGDAYYFESRLPHRSWRRWKAMPLELVAVNSWTGTVASPREMSRFFRARGMMLVGSSVVPGVCWT